MMSGFVGEGRTVFLSSHLLDEVQKTCDHVAIIDQGDILMQGLVEDIARGGHPEVRIRCDSAEAAERLLKAHPAVNHCRQPGTNSRRHTHRGARDRAGQRD